MSHTPILAVIFDMDGVLTDSEPLINSAAIAMFAEKGLTVLPEDFHPFVGYWRRQVHRRGRAEIPIQSQPAGGEATDL